MKQLVLNYKSLKWLNTILIAIYFSEFDSNYKKLSKIYKLMPLNKNYNKIDIFLVHY